MHLISPTALIEEEFDEFLDVILLRLLDADS